MMKRIILLMMILMLIGCTNNEVKESISPAEETIPFGYIYNYDDEPLKKEILYDLDFEYLEFPYFANRIALPTIGEFCKEPLSSQPDITCEVLVDEIYYYDINAILANISDDMYVSELDYGYDVGKNVHYQDSDFYKVVEGKEIIPIPSIYSELSPHFRTTLYGFNGDDIPYYEISNIVELKTSNWYDLNLSYIEIDEAYLIQVVYHYTYYPTPSNHPPVKAYGYTLK